jgi:hypothetical protein
MKLIDAVESCARHGLPISGWGRSNAARIQAASNDTLGTKSCPFSRHVGVNGYITPFILNLGTRWR